MRGEVMGEVQGEGWGTGCVECCGGWLYCNDFGRHLILDVG